MTVTAIAATVNVLQRAHPMQAIALSIYTYQLILFLGTNKWGL